MDPYLYVIGGSLGFEAKLPWMRRLNVRKQQSLEYADWEPCANMPTARRDHTCASVLRKVYCVYGKVSATKGKASASPLSFTNALEVFYTSCQSYSVPVPTSSMPLRIESCA